jgi:hypothetical protein
LASQHGLLAGKYQVGVCYGPGSCVHSDPAGKILALKRVLDLEALCPEGRVER